MFVGRRRRHLRHRRRRYRRPHRRSRCYHYRRQIDRQLQFQEAQITKSEITLRITASIHWAYGLARLCCCDENIL